eukprot:CCRYP_016098-RA/>CCRYP_016098-RA protein AED:0.38 eAED:0.38 QI:0/-1/0/1/-1/1/1/0/105
MGKMYNYLGIDFDFSKNGVEKLSMIRKFEKLFNDFPEEIGKSCASLASEHLVEVGDVEELERLGKYPSKELVQHFHHTMAKLLFIAMRVRRDIQTAVAFRMSCIK